MKAFIILTSLLVFTNIHLIAQTPSQIDSNEVFVLVEKMPKFPGGYIKFNEFLTSNFDFSKEIKPEKCFYELTVGKTGEVLSVVKLKGDIKNEEQITNVLKMTSGKWTTPSQNGHPVNVKLIITIEILKKQISGRY